ncbi:MAG TPA: TatD family hydrolase [Armatimonadota bacterium]|jgi:predicted TIM-barrel fold metal-dependent hydrolase|nr:TatD family hydrolase [Armatimonadota bacterium]HOM82492.1 TatD family hydrolase [Armatimonadota bacterium]HPO74574.1 TatD family hydrolase [Armatimonadota bacterium]
MKRVWIDTHIHVSDLGPDGQRRERMLEHLLDVLDRCDADLRFIISCDTPYFSAMTRDPDAILAGNRFIYELVRQAPGRLFGSCMVNPHFQKESLRAMQICFEEWGFVMLGEMLQYSMNYRMESDLVEPLLRLAARYDVPVQVHLGTYWTRNSRDRSTDGLDHIRGLIQAAERVPEAKYILAHAIGCGPTPDYIPWANMFLDTLAGFFPSFPDNFWVEIRDFHCPALARTLAEVPATRILAGTDWTNRVGPPFQAYGTMFGVSESENPFPPRVSSFVEFLRKAGASEEVIDRIGSRNATELFRLPATA